MHTTNPERNMPPNTTPVVRSHPVLNQPGMRWLQKIRPVWLLIPVAAVSFVALSTSSAPNIPEINLSADPLYSPNASDKPALALALSVEFPTVGAQYVQNPNTPRDNSYSNSNEYIGYYDAEACYSYNNSPTETPASGLTAADYKRFDRIGAATSRKCADAFSGNFLNWASSSAMDMLRMSLTGGDRYIDTPTQTILQRAVLPDGLPRHFWNHANFPGKQLLRAGGRSGSNFFGAVPQVLVNAAGSNNIWVVNTLNKIYFGTAQVGTNSGSANSYSLGGSALNSDGFFYARVQVCGVDSANVLLDARDYGLCKQYPAGNYKPTGAIQKYSDQVRLAVFGYLMDQAETRYGGVLRAPIKYVGPKTYDVNGVDNTASNGNPNQEWDSNTGVFISNPDGNTSVASVSGAYLSGVISYVNRFGRTGAVPGRYKSFDPLSELYYETLRYLQGLPPRAESTNSITPEMYDGFPVTTAWTDPYGGGRSNTGNYSCLKSNIVVIGDKNTNDRDAGGRLNRISSDVPNNIPDIQAWLATVRSFENNDSSATYIDGQGIARNTVNPNVANGTSPSGVKAQIMGLAYWARTHDIRGSSWTGNTAAQRPGLRVKTFVFDVNENGLSSNVNDRRTGNLLFMAAKYGGFETDPSNTALNPFNTGGNPFKRDEGTNDNRVWQDTDPRVSRQGEANTYFLQSDARSVLSSFDDIFSRASTSARSIAGGAIQSRNLTQVGSTIYQGTFDTSSWSGDLVALPVTVSSTNVVGIGSTARWNAATRLSALSAPATSRNIIVGNSGASASTAVDFKWATIGTTYQGLLNKVSPNSADDGLGQDRLNWLRGDTSKEGSPFRSRGRLTNGLKNLMGDVINSGVSYSGIPTSSINDAGYSTFYNANLARTPAVFVGANDGMLHAFNGDTGDELFAYIPSWLVPKLSALTSSSFADNHQSYLDGTPTVAEAVVASEWKTVLVAGTGGGGRGVFALDVTTPSAFTKSNVMWEFTNADDIDMGYVTGRPQILKMRTSAVGETPSYKWYAVVASGVNNYTTAVASTYSSGSPALFLLDLSKPAGTAWALGSNYHKISLPIDTVVSASNAIGLINFRAALGPAREVTLVFMGDLHGNLWKLDFTDFGTADWNLGKLSYFKQGTSNIPIPMFVAKDSAGTIQPITAAPSVIHGPAADTAYVVVGTGKYLENPDKTSTAIQSVYMLYDNGTTTVDASPARTATSAISNRKRLKSGSVNATAGTITFPGFILGRARTNTDSDNPRSGWRFDFPNSRERQIGGSTVFGDNLIFGSLIPGITSDSACASGGGGGNQYTVNIAGGNGSSVGSTVGILGEPLVAEIGSATAYTASDSSGRRTKTITSQVFQQGSDGVAAGNTKTRTVTAGRLSWRQINNYQDLKNSP
jgi:type IV pilus assembly protein PilY1